jgi:hypothetical protein
MPAARRLWQTPPWALWTEEACAKMFISYSHPDEAAVGPQVNDARCARAPWYRRPGILIAPALAALIAEVGIIVSAPGEPGMALGGTTGTSATWSASFSLVSTDEWTPDPTAPPAPEAPPPAAPPAAAPPAAPPPAAAPPPPPPSELRLWYGEGRPSGIPAFVSITNNAGKPPVGCVYTAVAVAGPATSLNYTDTVNFTVTGSAETRLDRPGPQTGTTWHVTVTCDNGLSTSTDQVY